MDQINSSNQDSLMELDTFDFPSTIEPDIIIGFGTEKQYDDIFADLVSKPKNKNDLPSEDDLFNMVAQSFKYNLVPDIEGLLPDL